MLFGSTSNLFLVTSSMVKLHRFVIVYLTEIEIMHVDIEHTITTTL